jgi:hypothetical protein
MNHFLALLGLAGLCGMWAMFQWWLRKKQADYQGYKAGCGACQNDNCQQ